MRLEELNYTINELNRICSSGKQENVSSFRYLRTPDFFLDY